jgi:GTP-binding protein EngB required for normal cell division
VSADTFEALTEQYFDRTAAAARRVAGVFHLIDARHPALRQDAAAHEWLLSHELPIAVVATKMDKLSKRERLQVMKVLAGNYGALVLPVSALKGTGLAEIRQTLREWTRSAVS